MASVNDSNDISSGRDAEGAPVWSTSGTTSARSLATFVGAWAALTLIPFVPSLVSPLPVSPYFPLGPEVLVLGTLAVYAAGTRGATLARVVASTGVGLLLVYETYDAIVYAAFHRSGLFAEDVQYVVDLAYLAVDNLTWTGAGGVGVGLVLVGGVAWAVPRCVRALQDAGRAGGCRLVLAVGHGVAWVVVGVVAPSQEWGTENLTYQTSNERTRVRTVATKVVENAQASARLHTLLDTLDRAPVDSTYFHYDALRLARRPHVYLYMIESYGEVLDRHPRLRAPYRRLMREMDATLSDGGWHAASTVVDAPVRGGRSWLAIASVLLGTRVDHQLLYERFQDAPDGIPQMTRFFERQGYRTVTCQPYTVARPGLPITNPYGFDVLLHRDDLQYTGPDYGWGVVPMSDQYSLGFAHERHLAPTAASGRPFFFFFETVLSHALWNYGLPPVLPDWRAFNDVRGPDAKATLAERALPSTLLPDSLTTPRIFEQPAAIRFLRHVAFEMEVLRAYLLRDAPPNSLVLLMGDHQPPILDTETDGVPIHVLSRDARQVDVFTDLGFAPGFTLPDTMTTTSDPSTGGARRLRHEGLYALLVRALVAHDRGVDAATSPDLPPLKPNGVPRSILTR